MPLKQIYGCLLTIIFLILSLQFASAQNNNDDNFITDFLNQLLGTNSPSPLQKRIESQPDQSLLIGKDAETRLQYAIKKYETIVKKGGWKEIKLNYPLQLGNKDSKIPKIRERLIASGDLSNKTSIYSEEFNQAVHEALVQFQERHGLRNKGILGKQTIAALNVKAEVRLNQLRDNLARMQQLAQIESKDNAVVVNIPGYELYAYNKGRVEMTSKVIVGRFSRQTPTIEAQIVGVDFLPTWRVPTSIAKRDLIPHIIKDPTYLNKENFKLVRLSDGVELNVQSINWHDLDLKKVQLQQEPGQNNALGLIRINMPNTHIVYLHDTPLKKLFNNTSRGFSSGCIRVQNIKELASWLLSTKSGWDKNRTEATLLQGKPYSKPLEKNIPIYLIYLTSWVAPDGTVNFREDIYKKDNVSIYAQQYMKQKLPIQNFAP